MNKFKKNKVSIYIPGGMVEEIHAESKRLDRPLSYIIQQVWKFAKEEISKYPSVEPAYKPTKKAKEEPEVVLTLGRDDLEG